MPNRFSPIESFECGPVSISEPRLNMVDEQCSDTTHYDAQWDVDNPMYPKIQNGKSEQDGIPENELVIAPVLPIFEFDIILFHMKPI